MCHKLDHEACWTKVENDTTPLTHSPGQKKKKKNQRESSMLVSHPNERGREIYFSN